MHLDQNGHNNQGLPLPWMNECKEENNKMNGAWRREKEEEKVTRVFPEFQKIDECTRRMFVHKTKPQLGARTHEWVGPKKRSEHGLELYSQDTDWAGHLHIPFNYTNWASKNKSKATKAITSCTSLISSWTHSEM